MKKIHALALTAAMAALFATAPLTAENADKPRLAVFGFLNQTGDDAFTIPAETASGNLLSTMRMLNLFQVSEPDAIPRNLGEASLDQWCTRNNVDFVIFGTVSKTPNSTQEYQIQYFSHAEKKITANKVEEGESVLDVFTVIDDLTESILGTITKNKVSFGSIAFANKGVAGEYDVYLDNSFIQTNPAKFDRVPAGTHDIRIAQKGSGSNLVASKITIVQGKTETIQFALKELTEADKIKTTVVEKVIDNSKNGSYEEGMREGEKMAKGSSAPYFFAGCCLGLPGLLIPALIEPTVPGEYIAGKSADYIQGFQSSYKSTKKGNNVKTALLGSGITCATVGIGYAVTVAIVIANAKVVTY